MVVYTTTHGCTEKRAGERALWSVSVRLRYAAAGLAMPWSSGTALRLHSIGSTRGTRSVREMMWTLEVLCMLRMHPFVHLQWRNGSRLPLKSEGRAFKPGLRRGYRLSSNSEHPGH